MKRRSFLQLLGLSPALTQIPAPVEAAPAVAPAPESRAESGARLGSGYARLRKAYCIERDCFGYRMDVALTNGVMFHADAYVETAEQDASVRDQLRTLLRNEIRHRGLSLADAYAPSGTSGEKCEYIAL